MRRISALVVSVALAMAFVAPATASAAAPSAYSMLREQVASQPLIGALLSTAGSGSDLNAIYFNTVYKSSTKAAIRVAAHLHNGARIPGVLIMRKYAGKWYFSSITRGDSSAGVSMVPMPAGITSSVVTNAISEQSAHQSMLAGIVSGGYEKLTVIGRTNNVGTCRTAIKLSRGTRRATTGAVYSYAKTATGGDQYWFISTLK